MIIVYSHAQEYLSVPRMEKLEVPVMKSPTYRSGVWTRMKVVIVETNGFQ